MYHRHQRRGQEESGRLRIPMKGELIAVVESRLGTNKLRVRCDDGVMRIGRIPGKFKKRMWMRDGDVVIAKIWEIQGDKFCDVIWKYSAAQVDALKRKGFIKMQL